MTLREKYEELNEPLIKIVDGVEKGGEDDTEIRDYDDEDDEEEVVVVKTDPKPDTTTDPKPADNTVVEKKDPKTETATIRRRNMN